MAAATSPAAATLAGRTSICGETSRTHLENLSGHRSVQPRSLRPARSSRQPARSGRHVARYNRRSQHCRRSRSRRACSSSLRRTVTAPPAATSGFGMETTLTTLCPDQMARQSCITLTQSRVPASSGVLCLPCLPARPCLPTCLPACQQACLAACVRACVGDETVRLTVCIRVPSDQVHGPWHPASRVTAPGSSHAAASAAAAAARARAGAGGVRVRRRSSIFIFLLHRHCC